ncbi:hypothetical protein SAMN05660860_02086 [Geoalkalibacter ferrihydriticus]|uniref:RiboL-PSP-HEPN domain-containing protein n=2 Tax=Geoalkalibacter ferrihydriticus TaxID=392333 RepID=A0A0C2HR00_9BACT|nr:HEPN domain-containing protein [Geoalkalibacter ferrihydriticus]KIH77310.1 hypothetical protein GFER_00695 [Geoalkalibacter ferrihydriticus DSM 17813]SDM20423.1 hypothetical protein SAMN05660860_02086 [Geoalkalibacter ferrihydriticus]
MLSITLYEKYEELFFKLKAIIGISQERVINDVPDDLFSNNVNFFVKSYLINVCTYLEAYLQDVAFDHANKINNRVKSACVPYNFLYWKVSKEVKEKDLKFSDAEFNIVKKEISEDISGNPYKTIKLFRLLGVDLSIEKQFQYNKDLVNSVVVKRNNIIHHNDSANDISFTDILSYIDVVLVYMKSIEQALANQSETT